MKPAFVALVLSVSVVICSAKTKDEEPETKKSKRATDYYGNSYSSSSSNNYNQNYNNYNPPSNGLYDQPQCGQPGTCRNSAGIEPVDITWLNALPRQFYVTMGTCFAQKLAAGVLLNRDPWTNKELNEMCLTVFIDAIAGKTYFDGYGKQFGQSCEVPSDGKGLACTNGPENSDVDVDFSVYKTETCFPIDTDGKSYILYYRCINGRYEDLELLTTRPYIEIPVMKSIVDTALKLGLNSLLKDFRPFECQPPTYPYPFQNYLKDLYSSQYSSSQSCPAPAPAPAPAPSSYPSQPSPDYGSQYSSQYSNNNHYQPPYNSHQPSYHK